MTPGSARGSGPASPREAPTLDDNIEAGEALAKDPRRRLLKWNHYEGPYFTLRVGGGLLCEGAWRLTPMLNWHISDNLRLAFAYGYGQLDRFDLQGGTQFFQSRIQLTF